MGVVDVRATLDVVLDQFKIAFTSGMEHLLPVPSLHVACLKACVGMSVL